MNSKSKYFKREDRCEDRCHDKCEDRCHDKCEDRCHHDRCHCDECEDRCHHDKCEDRCHHDRCHCDKCEDRCHHDKCEDRCHHDRCHCDKCEDRCHHDKCEDRCHHDKCHCDKCEDRCHHDKCEDRCHHDKCHCDKCRCHEHKWDCDIDHRHDFHYIPGYLLPNPTILACGNGTGLAIPAVPAGAPFNPISVVSAKIDTTDLCKPAVKIDFSSTINYQALFDIQPGVGNKPSITSPFTVTFQLSKTCNDGSKIPLGSWTFTVGILADEVNLSETFAFTFCESHAYPAWCVYTVDIVKATKTELSKADVKSETASIVTSTLTAIASSSC